ncbi:hypothetical protein [Pseudonocardia sp.]|uniref:hypothetical protein n=1 Tax=Pseudonocardia sp. TaxID=60912 RepID=UPI003D0DA5DB
MTSVAELRFLLAEVKERLGEARGSVSTAQARLDEAATLFEDLAEVHGDTVVPPALAGARKALDDLAPLLGAGDVAVDDLDARL